MGVMDDITDAACRHFYPVFDDMWDGRKNVQRSDMRGTILAALRAFESADLGNLPHFVSGRWDRRNLQHMIEDLESNS